MRRLSQDPRTTPRIEAATISPDKQRKPDNWYEQSNEPDHQQPPKTDSKEANKGLQIRGAL
jgi:hypothetical protein